GFIGWQKDFNQAVEDLSKLVDEKDQVVFFLTPTQFAKFEEAHLEFHVERLRDFNRGKRKIVLARASKL
ncbi:MAG: hypothetical protein ACE1ZW_03515, partial [Nitrospirales bacterium]